jgi:hypothetical protein
LGQADFGEQVVSGLCARQEVGIAPHHIVEGDHVGQFQANMLVGIPPGELGRHSGERLDMLGLQSVIHSSYPRTR